MRVVRHRHSSGLARVLLVLLPVYSLVIAPLRGQETKPVPKDSMRVHLAGCSKGYAFTVRRAAEESLSTSLPEGTHLRMNGKKELMTQIKAREGSMIEITGIMKKGQYEQGIAIGAGVRIGPGSNGPTGRPSSPVNDQVGIDVEGWRQIEGRCPSR
jgi:hypothetical protein